jgi:hypothetical protein
MKTTILLAIAVGICVAASFVSAEPRPYPEGELGNQGFQAYHDGRGESRYGGGRTGPDFGDRGRQYDGRNDGRFGGSRFYQ